MHVYTLYTLFGYTLCTLFGYVTTYIIAELLFQTIWFWTNADLELNRGKYILLWEFDSLIKNDYFINDILCVARKKDHEKERNYMLKLCIR